LGRLINILLLKVILLAWIVPAQARIAELSGQVSGWAAIKHDDTQLGLRYIPELSLKKRFSEFYEISAEAAINAQGYRLYHGRDGFESDAAVDPYRIWIRLASPQFEMRAGQQKISFGSATLLRPLMWFDSIDPRDPLQLTTGIYGLLGRYYFLNNANIWVWALYGNEDRKGWESLPGDQSEIEFGGRVQTPFSKGEAGLSYHHRQVNPHGSEFGAQYPDQGDFTEHRIGLDGKWDIGAGLWFEGTVARQDFDLPEPRYQKLLTAGTDYTFDVGNGPHLLFEHFMRAETEELLGSGDSRFTSALSGNYPLNLLDAISVIVFYDWDQRDWSRFVTWQRTYDQWQIHLSAFWNPDRTSPTPDGEEALSYAGKGAQLMLVLNH